MDILIAERNGPVKTVLAMDGYGCCGIKTATHAAVQTFSERKLS
jgi:hypothetical protein